MTMTAPGATPTPASPRTRMRRVSPPPRGPQTRARGEQATLLVSSVATMVALVCLWVAAQLLVLGGLAQSRDQQLLYTEFRTQLAAATAPIGPVVPAGDPVALIQIPRLGVQQVVVEGTATGDTLAGPGHLRDTPLPGQAGTSVVFGRAATYGAPFRDLIQLAKGDRIMVVMAQGQVPFTVRDVRRAGDPLPQPLAVGRARLTLVTAVGTGRFGAVTPHEAVYVDAEAKKSFPAPAGRPTAVPASELVLATDQGALPALVLCLALLLALTLAIVAARRRWSAVLVWLVAAPCAMALAWLTTDTVMRLMPNLV